tara:strand:+ start:4260 stop:4988 length:729 start_codon:yes stop_codon:yes gene_type:complete
MEMKKYLTDDIFLNHGKLFYEKDGKENEVKKHNWHRILKGYGWEKLHKQWIKKLNTYLEKPINNSLFGCLDCGGSGDCLYHCISYVFNDINEEDYTAIDLRIGISTSLTEERYNELIEFYKIMNDTGDFDESWDPDEMTIEEFKDLIIRGGNEYWGDFLMLNLIKEYLMINLVILNSNELTEEYYNYPIFHEYDEKLDTIILLYENEEHFKLIGHFQGNNMVTLFNNQTIPKEILKMINYLR